MYVTRLRYNENGWCRPSRITKRNHQADFTSISGFGYEDWLFRSDWMISGWRYAFLQGVNKSYTKLLRERRPFDVTLYFVNPQTRARHYLCMIQSVECISTLQAERALETYRHRGWLDQMREEVESVEGDVSSLLHPNYTTSILNVRFKPEEVIWLPRDMPVSPESPLMQWQRYNLYQLKGDKGTRVRSEFTKRLEVARKLNQGAAGREDATTAQVISRASVKPTHYLPEHPLMQAQLLSELKAEYPEARVLCEVHHIDVLLESEDRIILYEIKTQLSPRSVLREAIGQLLEYKHFALSSMEGTQRRAKTVELVAVGRAPLGPAEREYLEQLRQAYHLPLSYREISLENIASVSPQTSPQTHDQP